MPLFRFRALRFGLGGAVHRDVCLAEEGGLSCRLGRIKGRVPSRGLCYQCLLSRDYWLECLPRPAHSLTIHSFLHSLSHSAPDLRLRHSSLRFPPRLDMASLDRYFDRKFKLASSDKFEEYMKAVGELNVYISLYFVREIFYH